MNNHVHSLGVRYLVATFLITWPLWGLRAILAQTGVAGTASAASTVLLLLGGFGPTIAAFVVRRDIRSPRGLANFLFARKKSSLIWLAVILLAATATYAFASTGLNPALPKQAHALTLTILGTFVSAALFFGGNEELGWRGILQPWLEERLSFPMATLATGAIWSLWHIPFWFTPGDSHIGFPFVLFALQALLLSFWLAGLRRRGGSVAHCMIIHGAVNTLMSMFALTIGVPLLIGLLGLTALSIWLGLTAKSSES